GNLQLDPVVARGVFAAAVPVHAKAEQAAVEMILDSGILDDEAGVKEAGTDLRVGASVIAWLAGELDERERVAFGIAKIEMQRASGIFGNRAGLDAVSEKIAAHLRDVVGGEGDLGKEIS